MAQRRYEDLFVWQKAHELVKSVYEIIRKYPASEQYILVSQMQRAVVSIAANIAEGQSRVTSRDFKHFLAIARGSAAEVDYYFILSRDLGYITPEICTSLRALCGEVISLVTRLMASLNDREQPMFVREDDIE